MRNLVIREKGIEEVYKSVLRWAEMNEMAISENNRGREKFLVKFTKQYKSKAKFSWGLSVFLFFLGLIIVAMGGASNPNPTPEESAGYLFLMFLPLGIYIISYFSKKKPKTAEFKITGLKDHNEEVILKVEVSPQDLEDAKAELTHLLNSLV